MAKPPAGWVKSQAGATFKAPHTFPGNDGYFRTTATVNVGGRMVDLPAGLKVAANAAQFVAPALAAIPGVGLGSATLAWLAGFGLTWAVNQWVKAVAEEPAPEQGYAWRNGFAAGGVACSSFDGHCTFGAALAAGRAHVEAMPDVYNVTWEALQVSGVNRRQNYKFALTPQGSSDYSGYFVVYRGPLDPLAVPLSNPATEQDWQGITGELPLAVAQELAARMPLPVDLPESLPLRVPLDSPQPIPATNPQRYKQQVVDIVPRPTLAEPWRVELKPGELESEDENMSIDPSELDEQSPEADPTAGEEPKPGLCEEYPDILACQKLGEVEEQPLDEKTVSLSIEATTGWGEGAGSCPADRSVTVLGRQVSMKWELFCDFADQVRPVVIAMAWLSAVLGFVGLSRREA